ncbi:MAG: alpha-amylase family glycosyl hydrolase, partial [Salinivirgaceae bacterium]
ENTNLTRQGSRWITTLTLDPGSYQYLIVADGVEMRDPTNADSVSNNMGGFNSLLTVGEERELPAPHLTAVEADGSKLHVRVSNATDQLLVFVGNKEVPETFYNQQKNEVALTIPNELRNRERAYVRMFAANEGGLSNDLLVPLHNGRVLTNTENLKRTDFEAATVYNVFTDRFYDGNPENTWTIDDPTILPKANYFGGDIEGVVKKIEDGYFHKLGINTIWISPLVKNPEGAFGKYPEPETSFSAYHGYWPISFTQINPHFGTKADLHKLVETAHKNEMNVLLDFVANHVHEEHPVIQENPHWKTELYLPDGSLNTERWDSHRLTTWFDVFLPTLDLTKPEVAEMLTDSAVYWIKEYNLDGFRHDATKHIPETFWCRLTQKLCVQVAIPENRRLYQLGETYGSPELISSYVNSGQLDAQFDFNMYDAIVGALAGGRNFGDLEAEIQKSLNYYGAHHLMGNITGNQDRARFIAYASGAVSFEEDAKKAGWTRQINVEDTVGYQKAAMLNAIVSTLPGLPVIYYGDEIGMVGGNDPDNRRMMRFDSLNAHEEQLKTITSGLFKFRRKALPLIYGDFQTVSVAEKQMAYLRTYLEESVLVVVNNAADKMAVEVAKPENFTTENIQSLMGNQVQVNENELSVTVPAYSFEIISNVK